MLISYGWLLAIVLASMFIGCCVGVVVMAMCKVSACSTDKSEGSYEIGTVPELKR